ncbi:hypothetical protein KBB59_01470 [Candidatus Woesebacteria bacterium]|jgi:hypothetical protein|nr:hypothetical protein [Candidatus Woesebacteria bacterium]HNV45112.1 hypothetical protein [Candidatus Woesebacteria bacterium]HOA11865.1 hypothetical protein [Candidatus Woesebacteria bacterium]HOC07584.1 hypothetical protein [Candidatus Woesebacteria bacterium]HOI05422.1 hypothetical protein [Candidatus Woesebacteria bacterium]
MLLLIFSQQNIPFNQGDDERLIVEQLFFASGGYYMVFGSISQTNICYNLH